MNIYFRLWAQNKQEYMIPASVGSYNSLLTVLIEDLKQAPSGLLLEYPSVTQV